MANISAISSGNTPQYINHKTNNTSSKGYFSLYQVAKYIGVGLALFSGKLADAAGVRINPQSKSLADSIPTTATVKPYINGDNVNKTRAENYLDKTSTVFISPDKINDIKDLTEVGPKETREQQKLNQISDFFEYYMSNIVMSRARSLGSELPSLLSDALESTKYISINDFFDVIDEASKMLVVTEDCLPQISVTYQNDKIVAQFSFLNKEGGSESTSTKFELKTHPRFAKFALNLKNNVVAYDLTGNNKHKLYGYDIQIISLADDVLNGRRYIENIKNVARRNTVADIIKKIQSAEENPEQKVKVKLDKKVFYEDAAIAHMCSGEVKNPQIDKKLLATINIDAANNFDLDKRMSDTDTYVANSIIDSSGLAVFSENQAPLEAHLNFVFSSTHGTLLLDSTGIYVCSRHQTIDINDKLAESTDNNLIESLKILSVMSDELNILPMATMVIDGKSIRVDGLDMQTIYQNSVKILTDKGVLAQTTQPIEQDQQQDAQPEVLKNFQEENSKESKNSEHHKHNPSALIKKILENNNLSSKNEL